MGHGHTGGDILNESLVHRLDLEVAETGSAVDILLRQAVRGLHLGVLIMVYAARCCIGTSATRDRQLTNVETQIPSSTSLTNNLPHFKCIAKARSYSWWKAGSAM
jgi:hypothetical protein